MNRKRPGIVLGVLLLGAAFVVSISAINEWVGKRNTEYGEQYAENGFDKIQVGMSSESVVSLIGDPVSRDPHDDYPVWALQEDSVRNRLGKDSKIKLVVWSYSSPKNPRRDYELIHVSIGPGNKVIGKERWVTD